MNIFDIFNLRKRCDDLERRVKRLEADLVALASHQKEAGRRLCESGKPQHERHDGALHALSDPFYVLPATGEKRLIGYGYTSNEVMIGDYLVWVGNSPMGEP